MKNFTEQVWQVMESYDRDSRIVARFTTEVVATAFKNQSTNSHYLDVFKENLNIIVFETVEEALTNTHERAKEAALAKLTSSERTLLGL
jgi:hypothetical protein